VALSERALAQHGLAPGSAMHTAHGTRTRTVRRAQGIQSVTCLHSPLPSTQHKVQPLHPLVALHSTDQETLATQLPRGHFHGSTDRQAVAPTSPPAAASQTEAIPTLEANLQHRSLASQSRLLELRATAGNQ
jgi:hypothetical protein